MRIKAKFKDGEISSINHITSGEESLTLFYALKDASLSPFTEEEQRIKINLLLADWEDFVDELRQKC